MKLNFLKNKKEQFLEEILFVLEAQLKKSHTLILNYKLKEILISFELKDSKIILNQNSGFVFVVEKDDLVSNLDLDEVLSRYKEETMPLLDFFVENYPLEKNDFIKITYDNIEYGIAYKTVRLKKTF